MTEDFGFSVAKLIGALLGDYIGEINERIWPRRLLWMPDADSLRELGEKAWAFKNLDGSFPDGDILLTMPVSFNWAELARAKRAGGKLINGYKFAYPLSVKDVPGLPLGWCGYTSPSGGIGYALSRDVAFAVCRASFARKGY